MSYPLQLLIVCPLLFFAGFADSIAGGGGTVSVPSLLLIGLPSHTALATNKMVMCVGTLTSTVTYGKNGRIVWTTALLAAAGAFFGATAGAKIALGTSERTLQLVLLILLPAAFIFLCLKKSFGGGEFAPAPVTARRCAAAFLSALLVGLYDGFFGPGAGTFYIMAFTAACSLTLPEASADAKVANLGSNFGALVMFLWEGKVLWRIALPGILFTVAGNYLGSRLAVKIGAKFIRPVMAGMLALLFVKTLMDML